LGSTGRTNLAVQAYTAAGEPVHVRRANVISFAPKTIVMIVAQDEDDVGAFVAGDQQRRCRP
jgi:hypothetical protein